MASKTALSRLPRELTRLPQPLSKAVKELDVDPNTTPDGMNAEACFQQGTRSLQSSFVRMVYAGWWFRRAKVLADGGSNWVSARAAELGMSRRAIYDAMQLSERADKLTASAFERYTQVEYSKITQSLRSFAPEELNALAAGKTVHGITFDELTSSTRREIENTIRENENADLARKLQKAERDKRDLVTRIEIKEHELKRLRETKGNPGTSHFPDYVEVARIESTALAESAHVSLDSLSALYVAHSREWGSAKHTDTQDSWFVGAAAIYFNLQSVVAKAEVLLKQMRAELPEETIGKTPGSYCLSDDEAKLALQQREMIVGRAEAEKARREEQRSARKRRRGRPPKPANRK